jgi:DNA-directed RNA polymerase specialized sigma24 family protein
MSKPTRRRLNNAKAVFPIAPRGFGAVAFRKAAQMSAAPRHRPRPRERRSDNQRQIQEEETEMPNCVTIDDHKLIRLYQREGRSLRQLASALRINHHRIKRRLRRLGVRVRSLREQVNLPFRHLDGAILKRHRDGWSGLRIARTLAISDSTVCKRLKDMGVDKGWRHPWKVRFDPQQSAEIARRYRNHETAEQIGADLGYSNYVILSALKRRGVRIRSPHGDYRNRPEVWKSAKRIVRSYKDGLSTLTLAKRFNCCDDLISRILHTHHVPIRGSWNGGLTPLARRIRSIPEYWKWSKAVRRRFGNACAITGRRGKRLHAHHLVPLTALLADFLAAHPELDPVRDVQELVRLARLHGPFFDADNGVLLCEKVHRRMVHHPGWPWQDDEVVRAYRQLGSCSKVARLLGWRPHKVRRVLARHRIAVEQDSPRPSKSHPRRRSRDRRAA